MDKLSQKYQQLLQSISSLKKAVDSLAFFKKGGKSYYPNLDFEEEYRMHRDSLIQRFEYTQDLFWKYLKRYLEDVFKLLAPVVQAPLSKEATLQALLMNVKQKNV
jgi:Nucleotidyltransferase substrate binding protein like